MPKHDLRLLALDGGGVRGLSTLQILKQLMYTIDPESPPKPCDYFNMIGGTSTGGLIAIMLGRLQMTVDECIDAYVSLSDRIFQKRRHRRFDSDELEWMIKGIVRQGLVEDALLMDAPNVKCKVFVCRATLVASSFFDPITIGDFGESFVDGATGANNPVYEVKCLVSIGTGVPSLTPFKGDLIGIGQSLVAIATETEKIVERFSRDKSRLDDVGRYYRFSVLRGLEDIGLEDLKQKNSIIAATDRYIALQAVFKQMKACADSISSREC
ncbi:phospholipase, patatin family protein [Phaeosphaeriaceae sp. PMI808]|nr:phospholipase, patatin family protein [Phaeosphaeriaceae sp. PMI808]